MPSTSDLNLLYGVLALQLDFVRRDQLIIGMQAWINRKQTPLGEILVEQGALAAENHQLLSALVEKHLQQHQNDPQQSLAAISSMASAQRELEQLSDSDLQASLGHLAPRPSEAGDKADDILATQSATLGSATSEGLRFRILRPHARGGLGEVSVAHDTELNREVALKEIQTRYADHPENRSRFLLEAQITGGLEHPGIVPVYGLGTYADGRPFYAMRFIRGDSLKDGIRKFFAKYGNAADDETQVTKLPAGAFESLEFRQLLGRFVDVCNAVAYAHARGVLHRDLKPGNIMLGNYGETLVVDWGLAKATGKANESLETSQAPVHPSTESNSAETLQGNTIGTPGYMSPEQAAGRIDQFSPATDIYCLGATLYHLLTGRPPHVDNTDGQLYQRIAAGEFAKPRDLISTIPIQLAAVCLKAMAQRPADRYATALALAADIEHWLADEPVTAHTDPPIVHLQRWSRRHRTLVSGAVALLATAVIGLTIGYFAIRAEQQETLIARNNAISAQQAAMIAAQAAKTAEKEAERNAALEAQSRKRAEEALTESERQLAANYFAHGLFEYEAGRVAQALRDLRLALLTGEGSNPARDSYDQVLADRLAHGGRAPLPPMLHNGIVWSVAYSPDGVRVVTASHDGTAQLWNGSTGTTIGEPMRHGKPVFFATFSPDNLCVVTVSDDGTARLWDASSGVAKGDAMRHDGGVVSARFSPDGLKLVTASHDGTARLWNAKAGTALGEPMRHDAPVSTAAFSVDSLRVVTASRDGTARLWDVNGEAIGEPMRHPDFVQTASFSPDGLRVVTGSLCGTAQLWDGHSGAPIGKPIPHHDLMSAAFSPDGLRIATTSQDGTARLWDGKTGAAIGEQMRHRDLLVTATFSPDGLQLLTASWDQTAQLWDAKTGAAVGGPLRHNAAVLSAAFSPDGMHIATSSIDGTARLWDGKTGTAIATPRQYEHGVSFAGYSPDGSRILTSGSFGFAQLTDRKTGRRIGSLINPKAGAKSAAFSTDGLRILTVELDGTARLWDGQTATRIGAPMQHDQDITTATFSPDGSRIVTGSKDGTARLWDGKTGTSTGVALVHDAGVLLAAYSTDGLRVVTVSDDTVRLWDAKIGAAQGKPMQHGAVVTSAAFSPDGSRIVSASKDNTARLWNGTSGVAIGEPMQHDDWVTSTAFSPDGLRIVTASHDMTARLWQGATGAAIGEPMRHDMPVSSAAFTSDGMRVVTVGNDTVRLWDGKTGAELGEPMRHVYSLSSAIASSDGASLMTTTGDNTAWLWNVTPTLHYLTNPAFAELWREVMTGEYITEKNEIKPLAHETWLAKRLELEKHPDWHRYLKEYVEPRMKPRHDREAAEAEEQQEWFAAAFHLKWLLKEKPDDPELKKRLALAEAKWQETLRAAEAAGPAVKAAVE